MAHHRSKYLSPGNGKGKWYNDSEKHRDTCCPPGRKAGHNLDGTAGNIMTRTYSQTGHPRWWTPTRSESSTTASGWHRKDK
jgi:hypothetical protein